MHTLNGPKSQQHELRIFICKSCANVVIALSIFRMKHCNCIIFALHSHWTNDIKLLLVCKLWKWVENLVKFCRRSKPAENVRFLFIFSSILIWFHTDFVFFSISVFRYWIFQWHLILITSSQYFLSFSTFYFYRLDCNHWRFNWLAARSTVAVFYFMFFHPVHIYILFISSYFSLCISKSIECVVALALLIFIVYNSDNKQMHLTLDIFYFVTFFPPPAQSFFDVVFQTKAIHVFSFLQA